MSMTISQRILSEHCGVSCLEAGELIEAPVDLILGNDLTAPVAIHEFEKIPNASVNNSDRIVIVMDHFTPNKDVKAAEQCRVCRNFAKKHGIKALYDVGKVGIEHVLLPEQGYINSGDLIIGADSHTCTYGALGAFATGIGSTDMAAAMLTGKLWFQVPRGIKIVFKGKKNKWVSGKDIILYILRLIGTKGADYCSLEFAGDIRDLTMDDRLTICNMAVEAGAKNGIFIMDQITEDYLRASGAECKKTYAEAADDAYERVILVDLGKIEPVVAFPSTPDQGRFFSDFGEICIDQIVIGSCTNGRLSDLAQAAEILRGRKVADGIRVIIIPATVHIYQEALKKGYISEFVQAGCAVMPPCCGPCIGGGMGILAKGEKALVTTNRNFRGRMGHVESELYLCSPAVAAASAVTGRITHPEEIV